MLKVEVSENLKNLAKKVNLNDFYQKDLAKQLGVAAKTVKNHLGILKITHEKSTAKNYIVDVLTEESNTNPFLNTTEIKEALSKKRIKHSLIHIRNELKELVKNKKVFRQALGKINFFTLKETLVLKDYVDAYKYTSKEKITNKDVDLIIELSKKHSVKEIRAAIDNKITTGGIYYILKKNNIKEYMKTRDNESEILEKITVLPKDESGVFLVSYTEASELLNICRKFLSKVARRNKLKFKRSKKVMLKVKQPKLKIVKEKVSPLPRPKKEDPAKAAMEVKVQEAKKIEKELIKKESSLLGFCDFSVRNPSCLNRTSREKIEVFPSFGGRFLCSNCMSLAVKRG